MKQPLDTRIRSALATLGLALLVIACASGPKVFTNVNPAASFGNYRTYSYAETLGTDERKGYRSILSNYLIDATDRELQSRGYRKVANGDLVVNFYVHTKEKIRTTSSPTMGGYYGYRAPYYGAYGGYETQTTQYTEGTLNIDLADTATDELAWEGVAVGRVTDDVRNNLEVAVNNAVAEIFTRFSYTAPGFVPVASSDGG
jgi:hypothetical protein